MKRVAALLGTALLLAACGQSTPTATAPELPTADAGATDYSAVFAADYAKGPPPQWTYTAPADRIGSLALRSQAATDNTWTAVVSATNGWGPIELNQSVGERNAGDGHPLNIGGKVYAQGLGLHANADLTYTSSAPFASGLACTLEADVGIDAEVGRRGSVIFQGWADGAKLYDTGVLRGGEAARHIKWAIPAARSLQLKVIDAGDGIDYDHADLAAPVLTCTLAAPVTPTTVRLEKAAVQVYHLHHTDVQATFGGSYRGPVDLRLEDNAPSFIPSSQYTGVVLQTKQVNLTGPATVVPLTFAAPTLPARDLTADPAYLKNTYRLVASVNGKDVASTNVSIEELLLNITTRFEPGSVSGVSGAAIPGTIVVTFSPPLEGNLAPQQTATGIDTAGRNSCAYLGLAGTQTFTPSETRIAAQVSLVSGTGQTPPPGTNCSAGGYLSLGGYVFKRYGYYSGASDLSVNVTYK
jgi:NPCBM/NEW2 domain